MNKPNKSLYVLLSSVSVMMVLFIILFLNNNTTQSNRPLSSEDNLNTELASESETKQIPVNLAKNISDNTNPADTESETIHTNIKYTLTNDVNPSDSGTVECNDEFSEKTNAKITAAAEPGYHFDYWTGDVADPSSVSTTIFMDKDKSVTANFRKNQCLLKVTCTGSGTGSVNEYNPSYDALSKITVTAEPDGKSLFNGWFKGDKHISDKLSYTFIIEENTILEARFEKKHIPADVTDKIQLLGNPFNKQTYARNVWDMQVFNDSIYLGHGNSSNYGPDTNAGPIDVIKYNPKSNTFDKEYTVNEEQIDIYKIINNKLYIPGHDPKESWSLGNFYVLDNGQWEKVRTVPKAVHIYDMAQYKGKLYAATGSNGFSEVVCSADNGQTWEAVTPDKKFVSYGLRAYTLFEFKEKLYAASVLTSSDNVPNNNLICIDGSNTTVISISGKKMFPGIGINKLLKLVRPTAVSGKLLYIAGEVNNDHQHIPAALYISNNVGSAKRIAFAESTAVPYDILVRKSTIYVLASEKLQSDSYRNVVYHSTDLNTWIELFSFRSDTFARSFEEINGNFYFGLGCDTEYLPDSTGNILKVAKTDYLG